MLDILIAIVALGTIAGIFGAILGFASIKFKVEGDPLVEQLDDLLPQTQCGQCDYPGCKPYAEAIAKGEAPINQCPPGGQEGIKKLAELLDVEVLELNPDNVIDTFEACLCVEQEDVINSIIIDGIMGPCPLLKDKIEEFEDDIIEKRQIEVAEKNNIKLTHHSLYLYGVCQPNCEDR